MNDREELISKENEAVLIEVLGPFWSAFFCSSGHDSRALLNPLLNRARSIPDGYVLVKRESE